MFSSFFGYIFEGCWHDYDSWSKPDSRLLFQFKKCSKCGKMKSRRIRAGRRIEGGAKPKKPNSPPNVSSTPKPPTGGTAELTEEKMKEIKNHFWPFAKDYEGLE